MLEKDVYHMLSEKGYLVVRSAGSKSPCDLIAVSENGEVYCIQCKKTTKNTIPYIRRSELADLQKLEEKYRIKVLLAIRFRLKGRWYTKLLSIQDYIKLREEIKNIK